MNTKRLIWSLTAASLLTPASVAKVITAGQQPASHALHSNNLAGPV